MKSDEKKIQEVIEKLDKHVYDELSKIASEMNLTYEQLMEAADKWLNSHEETEDPNVFNAAAWYNGNINRFWDLYEQVRGVRADAGDDWFFVCNC